MKPQVVLLALALALAGCASREDAFYAQLSAGVGHVMKDKDNKGK